MRRSLVGIFIAKLFLALVASGIWLFWFPADEKIIVLHVVFAFLFLVVACIHLTNNMKILRKYARKHLAMIFIVLSLVTIVTSLSGNRLADQFVGLYARFQQHSLTHRDENVKIYQGSENPNISITLRAGRHFWFPQIAVWITDTTNNYLETLFVTHSTAKGEFYDGRSKENFKQFDQSQENNFDYRRVDALPFWSKQFGILAKDGRYAPTRENPLPDGISGATPAGSMLLNSKINYDKPYRLLVELNVAFDDNKYYSQYDFAEDTLYHSGTGLLGQPSVVYATTIFPHQHTKYYLLEYVGYSHPSKYEPLVNETYGLTTALEILDLGLIRIN
ncbi:MAG: hypothetical protein AAF620_17345 [Bacteroidota bacterium]